MRINKQEQNWKAFAQSGDPMHYLKYAQNRGIQAVSGIEPVERVHRIDEDY